MESRGEDEALILVSNSAVPAKVDTAVRLDAEQRATTDLPEECVAETQLRPIRIMFQCTP